MEIPVTWPKGAYGLPRPSIGCANSHFTWATGWRFQDTEDTFPDNFWSNPCHLEGPYYSNDAYQTFCMKTVEEEDIYEWGFPEGAYCVYKKGSTCPPGKYGFILIINTFHPRDRNVQTTGLKFLQYI